MTDVRVHVYTVCWNEEKIMPFFLNYYSSFAERIIVYDNNSTDRSPEIVKACKIAEMRVFDTGNKFDDKQNLHIKNTAYRESVGLADFVIVVDMDEFIYHPDIKTILSNYKKNGITLARTIGFDMVSLLFPYKSGLITDYVRLGRENLNYNKSCLFSPTIEINYNVGCHVCKPVGDIKTNQESELKLLHFHYVGLLKTIQRHHICKRRLSRFNIDNKLGYQYTWGTLRIIFVILLLRLICRDVINNKQSFLSLCIAPIVNMFEKLYKEMRPIRR